MMLKRELADVRHGSLCRRFLDPRQIVQQIKVFVVVLHRAGKCDCNYHAQWKIHGELGLNKGPGDVQYVHTYVLVYYITISEHLKEICVFRISMMSTARCGSGSGALGLSNKNFWLSPGGPAINGLGTCHWRGILVV